MSDLYNKDFGVELSMLSSAATEYENYVINLSNYLKSANTALDRLKDDGWDGDSKEAFFGEIVVDWNKGVNHHIDRLEILRDLLKKAEGEFEDLDEIARSVKDKI